ncbi:MAG: bifunctional diguanylate cyclase/phosphodiesterase [Alphaproteobacteria bacterium]|nr:bifunctional diguanylate cyclase/phosphodiesterase [Alphaproteobacteria bacterium]
MNSDSKRINPEWSSSVSQSTKLKTILGLSSAPAQIWKSRLSWRITLAVFLTIMAVQAGIMALTLRDYEQARLGELVEAGRSAIVPLIDPRTTSQFVSPINDEDANRLISTTLVNGIAVYSAELNLIRTYGEPIVLTMLDRESLAQTYRTVDGSSYEVVFRPNDLQRPYIVVARLNSDEIGDIVNAYVEQTILVMLLMSAFVTSVLMLALGHWLLEPILFMRDNLLSASEDPENPNIQDSPYNPNDEIGGAISIAQRLIRQNADNIRRIKAAAEDQIHKLAYYDTLTGLPNRTLFVQKLSEQARLTEDRSNSHFAVITMDLDHFKDINDSMGHNVGDAILRAVGKRLRAALPPTAIVAKAGEDEFAIMMPLNSDVTTARDVGERILGVIRSEPFKVFNENFQVRASIGVATYPDDGIDPDQVLKNADIALNRAKEEGRDCLKEYSEDFDIAVQLRFQMLRDLRDALEHGQLSLYYQPQLDLRTGRLIGAEALLRWWKPDNSKEGGHFIPPVEFIPIAEQSGLIVPIGEWVLREACEKAMTWREHSEHPVRVAVNVSGAQFHQSDLCALVEQVLEETGLPARQLEMEVTESVFMDDINHTIQVLQHLHSIGVELAIDDFGTGYSSLSYLRQFPIDRLKIDQSFIRNALNNPDDASIARTIVGLGHSLNLKVIAEGVETQDHERFLVTEGCDEVQGFRYSRPVPADQFVEFVKGYNGDLSSFD